MNINSLRCPTDWGHFSVAVVDGREQGEREGLAHRVVGEGPVGWNLYRFQEHVPLVGGCHRVVGVELGDVDGVAVAGEPGGEHLDGGHHDAAVLGVDDKLGTRIVQEGSCLLFI